MAVYTEVDTATVAAFAATMGLSNVTQLKPTSTGIENTNYFFHACTTGSDHPTRWVLTLFEQLPAAELHYAMALTRHLAQAGFPVPAPLPVVTTPAAAPAAAAGSGVAALTVPELAGKPALICPAFPGQHPHPPNDQQCYTLGATLARIHLSSASFAPLRANDRGHAWQDSASLRLAPALAPAERGLLLRTSQHWSALRPQIEALPHGITHNDLFTDNALFDGDKLTGIIDFYSACTDCWLYDLAVTVNDWCSDANEALVPERYQAMLAGYQSQRPLTSSEWVCWADMLQFAALRFWISRLLAWPDISGNRTGRSHDVAQKDPSAMRRRLQQRQRALPPIN